MQMCGVCLLKWQTAHLMCACAHKTTINTLTRKGENDGRATADCHIPHVHTYNALHTQLHTIALAFSSSFSYGFAIYDYVLNKLTYTFM